MTLKKSFAAVAACAEFEQSMTRKAYRKSKIARAIVVLIAVSFMGVMGYAKSRNYRPDKDQPEENASQSMGTRQAGNAGDSGIHVVPVQGNIYMLVGAGGNITVQVDNDGILLVDTGLAQMSDKVLSAIRTISNKPIRFIINTSADKDVVGGNEAIAKVGSSISPPVGADGILHYADIEIKGASIISFQSALDRMSDPKSRISNRKTRGLSIHIRAARKAFFSTMTGFRYITSRRRTRTAIASSCFTAPMWSAQVASSRPPAIR